MTYGDRKRGTSSAVLRYNHDGKIHKIDANANFSRSWDEREDLAHGFFRTVGLFSQGSLRVRADGLSGIYCAACTDPDGDQSRGPVRQSLRQRGSDVRAIPRASPTRSSPT